MRATFLHTLTVLIPVFVKAVHSMKNNEKVFYLFWTG